MQDTQTLPQAGTLHSGRWVAVLLLSIGVLALVGFLLMKLSARPSLLLNTCFQDASGLRPLAKVRLAGVEIGTVRSVRAQPTDKACPAAVEMKVQVPYELNIPGDSVASIATAGILGETYLEIDVSKASGPPVQPGGQLPSKENSKFTAATVDRMLKAVQLLKQLSDEERNGNADPTATPNPTKTK